MEFFQRWSRDAAQKPISIAAENCDAAQVAAHATNARRRRGSLRTAATMLGKRLALSCKSRRSGS
jgi:hypothetical protein